MLTTIHLEGDWGLQLDSDKRPGLPRTYSDTIALPGTTSFARKGKKNEEIELGALTDEYAFEGYAWFSKEVEIPEHLVGRPCQLVLERTRVTTVWVDGRELGTQNSLNAPHVYDLTGSLEKTKHTLTIRVDNTDYPTKGGHLTSKDTQTNWNGITGQMELRFFGDAYLQEVQVYPEVADKAFTIKASVAGDQSGAVVAVSAVSFNGEEEHAVPMQKFPVESDKIELRFPLGSDALLWSDQAPNLYKLRMELIDGSGEVQDTYELTAGLREFKVAGDKFEINGIKTFLRGKHDGLIFPLTGYAPTTVDEWLRIMGIAKSYGINHYRFHTCCPPAAAFEAADRLGIYMEPELPFWGTITDETYEQHNQAEQEYLIREGYAILKAFGNHPSFVMMSLGNELWGSKPRLDAILKAYKECDDRHLYTQGSNNFQFMPDILEHDDFYCGVRFSRDRLFRGSYAMCDAPLGHVQTDQPNTRKDYDEQIIPSTYSAAGEAGVEGSDTVQIQFGTEAVTVRASDRNDELVPHVPVVSHEIGQYSTFPNFAEIEKFTGSIKARNYEVFRERLEEKGLGHLAAAYFECSGKLAVACYKEELEAAFRSKKLAGFQLLDLQDFPGQGTALVGVLDAFMDSKGLVTPEEWRSFCSDAVLLARFDTYHYVSQESFAADVELCYYRSVPLDRIRLKWELHEATTGQVFLSGEADASVEGKGNNIDICRLNLNLPNVSEMTHAVLSLSIEGTDIQKSYELWLYPKGIEIDRTGLHVFEALTDEAASLLENGENVLLMPKPDRLEHAVEGFYSTDFWCYPMFRSISESMNKPVPVGTMGLYIDKDHPALRDFPSERYSTYPWWNVVTHSSSIILDDLPKELSPIVQTIDNFERNHKLGLLFECRVGKGKLLVCSLDAEKAMESVEGKQFLFSIMNYVQSSEFQPQVEIRLSELRNRL
ncbi:glycoside hydrolase family 2 TIM barrel-domain containing protein [Gorillibacterium timonense]|uniref:glycoside hydrolase family 2 TIM barrel-domain containing protein n=1 Tax=Gorillibacterium timonense TaxID=1689269 RepID=UPI00071C4460|nr:glycoside hydrolase family 2 TIM barrel-domain containing protein [Gorillibacterium timonense]